MTGFCPPISAWAGIPRPAAAVATWWPTAADPVKETASTSGCPTSALPVSPAPATNWSTPSGRPSVSASRTPHAVESGEGLSTATLPQASAGASFHTGMATGKFHGVIRPTTPRGRRRVSSIDPGALGGSTSPSGSRAACA